MSRLLVALLVAAFLAPGFPAQAHATGAHHVTPKTVLLPPLSSNETVLEFEGGPLFEGWVFVLVARTRSVGVTVAAALRTGGAAVASWDLPADSDVRRFALLPQTATYTLPLSHPSPAETVAVDFYFDQSCSCLGKYLPYKPPEILFREALVLFNFDFGVGDKVDVIVPEPNALNLRVTLATRPGAGVEFPSDFNVLEVSNDATPYRATPSSPWFRIHRFQFTAAVAGTHYFFVEPTQYLAANYSDPLDPPVQPSGA